MDTKILTISIAAYNVGKYLRQTLDSLVMEKEFLEKIEVLIVDDGSKDETKKIAKEYEQKYENSFFCLSKENGGYGSTINHALKHAKGKYFKLLDGDDWYDTENLKKFIVFLENTDADIVLTPYKKVYEVQNTEEVITKHEITKEKVLNITDLKSAEIKKIFMHELTVKTALLQKNHIEITENCFYTDTEFAFMPLLYAKTLAKFDSVIYCYRVGVEGQSVSLSGRRKHWIDGEKVEKKLIQEYCQYEKELAQNIREALFDILIDLAGFQYTTFFLMPKSGEVIEQVKSFDSYIRERLPELYVETGNKYKKIKVLRLSRFLLFSILGSYVRNHMKES